MFSLAAGYVELAQALSIEPIRRFTRHLPTVLCAVLGVTAVSVVTRAIESLLIGTVYAVVTVIFGILVAGDPATPGWLVSIGPIVAGVVSLRLSAGA